MTWVSGAGKLASAESMKLWPSAQTSMHSQSDVLC